MIRELMLKGYVPTFVLNFFTKRWASSKYGFLGWNKMALEPYMEKPFVPMGNSTIGGK